ncbi:MAG: hypothetical protein AAGA56_06845 [Myxococcota bacterium]
MRGLIPRFLGLTESGPKRRQAPLRRLSFRDDGRPPGSGRRELIPRAVEITFQLAVLAFSAAAGLGLALAALIERSLTRRARNSAA